MNFANLDRQHRTIMEEINLIEKEIIKDIMDINPSEAALHISRLAGQLKIHLREEDDFLYPQLMNSTDSGIKKLANQYISEMGDLAAEYITFKNKYNIASKIRENRERFLTEGKIIITALRNRIEKENCGLYHLIKERNL
jgi:hypothetical protein